MELDVGDLVVVPGCGVGRVEALEEMDVGEGATSLFRIDLGDDRRMWIPKHRVAVEGLRAVMSKDRANKTFEVVSSFEAPEKRANWNRRQRRYNEMLMSNEPQALAELLGELAAVRSQKALSFGERKLFDRVLGLLTDELAAALEKPREKIEKKLAEAMPAAA